MPSRPAKPPSARKAARHAVKQYKVAAKKRLKTIVSKKREHRETLSEKADSHWKLQGRRAQRAYLERVRTALEGEGFRSTPFQWRHKGHEYGLIKDVGDKQIHVRVYEDGVIDAEIEVHKRYLEHLWSPRPSAHREVMEIFRRHGIPIHFVNEHYLPQVGAHRRKFPKGRTSVAQIVAGAAGGIGIVGLYTARIILGRMKKGRLLP